MTGPGRLAGPHASQSAGYAWHPTACAAVRTKTSEAACAQDAIECRRRPGVASIAPYHGARSIRPARRALSSRRTNIWDPLGFGSGLGLGADCLLRGRDGFPAHQVRPGAAREGRLRRRQRLKPAHAVRHVSGTRARTSLVRPQTCTSTVLADGRTGGSTSNRCQSTALGSLAPELNNAVPLPAVVPQPARGPVVGIDLPVGGPVVLRATGVTATSAGGDGAVRSIRTGCPPPSTSSHVVPGGGFGRISAWPKNQSGPLAALSPMW